MVALVQIMAWHSPGNKPLSEAMVIIPLMHICVTRPQSVNHPLTHCCIVMPYGNL